MKVIKETSAFSGCGTSSRNSTDAVTLLVALFDLIASEILAISADYCNDLKEGCLPLQALLSVEDQIDEQDELKKMRDHPAANSFSLTISDERNRKSLVVVQWDEKSLFLYSYCILGSIFGDEELLRVAHRLRICENLGFIPDTPANRFQLSRSRQESGSQYEECGYYSDDFDLGYLWSPWTALSTNPSIDGTALGQLMCDSWQFQLKLGDGDHTTYGTFEAIFSSALGDDGMPVRDHLPQIDDLHSLMHAAFEISGARRLLQPAIDRMWWNDDKLLEKYAVEAATCNIYRNSTIAGNALLTQALHFKPCQFFGRTLRSLLHGRIDTRPDPGPYEHDYYQYFSFSLLDANGREFPFLAEIMLGSPSSSGILERGVIYTYVRGERSCLVSEVFGCGVYFDMARLREAMPSFAIHYKPHGEFHRSFIRYWQAKSVIKDGVHVFPGCTGWEPLRQFEEAMGHESSKHLPPRSLDIASIDDLLEIEQTSNHSWFRTEFLSDGSFGENCPSDPQKTYHQMIAASHLTPEQELQFELELATCAAMRLLIDWTNGAKPAAQYLLLSLASIQPLEVRSRFAELVRKEQKRMKQERSATSSSTATSSSLSISPSSSSPAIVAVDPIVPYCSVDDLASSTPLPPDLAGIVKEYLDTVPLLPFVLDEMNRMDCKEWTQLLEPWCEIPRLDEIEQCDSSRSAEPASSHQ